MPTSDLHTNASSRAARAALVAALALAAVVEWSVALRSPIIAPDGIHYLGLARDLVAAPLHTMQIQAQHPGYPLLVAAAGAALLDPARSSLEEQVWAARLPSMIAGVLGVVAVWLLARRMFDERVAGVAALLFAVLPVARQNAADALGDAPHLLFYLLGAWAVLAGLQSGKAAWFALAGTASAAAFWIRPEGWSVAIVAAALLALNCLQAAANERARWALCFATLVAFTAALSAPYVVLSGKITDKLRYKQNLQPSIAAAPAPRWNGAPLGGPAGNLPLATIGPMASVLTATALLRAAAELAEQYTSQLNVLLPLALIGLLWRRPAAPRPEAARLANSLGCFHASLLILLFLLGGYIDRRHVLPLMALAMPWAAAGLLAVAALLAEQRPFAGRPRARAACTGALLLAVAALWLPRSLRALHEPYQPQLEAARWIRAHGDENDPLIANSPYVGFYAERQTEVYGWPDYGHPPPLAERVRAESARFIVFDIGASEHYDPAWLDSLGGQYSLAHRIEGVGRAKRHTVLIYELTRLAARPAASPF